MEGLLVGSNSASNENEVYNVFTKQWKEMPKLNEARANSSLCIVNEVLYVFNGWNRKLNSISFLSSIEYIILEEASQRSFFNIIQPKDPGMCWGSMCSSCVIPLSDKEILIIGGVLSFKFCFDQEALEDSLSSSTFYYQIESNEVYRGKNVQYSCAFNNYGSCFDNQVFAIDNLNSSSKPFGVHVLNMKTNNWKFNQV